MRSVLLFAIITASALLVSAQGQGQGQGQGLQARPGSEDLGLNCPARQQGGSGGSGGSGNATDDDVMEELGEQLRRKRQEDIDDVSGIGSGSGSGSGGCGGPLIKNFCYTVLETVDDADDGNGTVDEACLLAFSEDSCYFCLEYLERCGEPEQASPTGVCNSARSFGEECSYNGPTDCLEDPEDGVYCDLCSFYTDTCTSEDTGDALAICRAFGFRVLRDCAEVLAQDEYDCECFSSALICGSCEEVVEACTGAVPDLPPGISKQLSALTDEEENNAVTTRFRGLSRFDFVLRVQEFQEAVADAVNDLLTADSRKRVAGSVTADDVTLVEPCPCQDGNDLEVVYYVSGDAEGSAIEADVVEDAADSIGDSLAGELGADSYASTSEGIPEDDNDDGLSNGEIAAIVVVICVVAIVAVLAVVLVMVFVLKGRSGSHNIGREKIPLN